MRQERSLRVQIFATDLDLAAIETARAGVYPSGIATDVTAERLRRWFVQEDGHYRVKKDIRDLVIFAPHDLLTDPPFTKLDLLSCRNLLIYLESRAQRRLMPLFHYALRPGGLLFLGASESVDQHENLFSTVDRKWKIFRRVNARRQVLDAFPIGRGKTRPVEAPPAERREVPEAHALATLVERMLLTRSGHSGVVVDKRGETLYVAGRAGEYLEPAAGEPPHRLVRMAREDLRHDLTAVLREAARTADEAVRRGVRVRINGGTRFVNIAVTPITEPGPLRGLFLVTFETVPSAGPRRLGGGIGARRGARGRQPRRSWTSSGTRSSASSTRWRKRRRTTRSSRRPTRSSRVPTRSSRAATRSWRRGGRRCNRSTRSWRRSMPSSEPRSTTSPTPRATCRTCSTARTRPRSSWMPI